MTAADKLRAMRDAAQATVASNAGTSLSASATPSVLAAAAASGISTTAVTARLPTVQPSAVAQYAPPAPSAPAPSIRVWRDALAAYGAELARGVDPEAPLVALDTELGDLSHRLGLTLAARRALVALYATYLVGQPALSIARLARIMGDWSEALGQGQLGALALLDRKDGTVRLAQPVTDLLDGAAPREVRLVGGAPSTPHLGAHRMPRESRTDAEIEAELATRFHRIAIIEGACAAGLLEARIHGATAVTFIAPSARPRPWPHGAGLVIVLYGTQAAWLADLPNLA